MTQADINQEVVETAKRIEEYDGIDDIDPLEIKVKADIDHTAREFIAVLTVGGPHIELNVTKGTISGSWGMESHTTHVNNDELLEQLHDQYQMLWDTNE